MLQPRVSKAAGQLRPGAGNLCLRFTSGARRYSDLIPASLAILAYFARSAFMISR